MGNFEELEKDFGLLFSFRTVNESLDKIKEILESNSKKEWAKKRDKMLDEKIDVTSFMIKFFEKNLV